MRFRFLKSNPQSTKSNAAAAFYLEIKSLEGLLTGGFDRADEYAGRSLGEPEVATAVTRGHDVAAFSAVKFQKLGSDEVRREGVTGGRH